MAGCLIGGLIYRSRARKTAADQNPLIFLFKPIRMDRRGERPANFALVRIWDCEQELLAQTFTWFGPKKKGGLYWQSRISNSQRLSQNEPMITEHWLPH